MLMVLIEGDVIWNESTVRCRAICGLLERIEADQSRQLDLVSRIALAQCVCDYLSRDDATTEPDPGFVAAQSWRWFTDANSSLDEAQSLMYADVYSTSLRAVTPVLYPGAMRALHMLQQRRIAVHVLVRDREDYYRDVLKREGLLHYVSGVHAGEPSLLFYSGFRRMAGMLNGVFCVSRRPADEYEPLHRLEIIPVHVGRGPFPSKHPYCADWITDVGQINDVIDD
jgi:hypothetical protein